MNMPIRKPCCPSAAARMVKKINIDGDLVGIVMLDSIIADVSKLDIDDEKEIKEELLRKVKIYNYVPPREEDEYKDALFSEYKKRVYL
jgi:hypothetical protein